MAEEIRKLPIGVQSFEKMREDGFSSAVPGALARACFFLP